MKVDWVAADWGSTNLRCWAMSESDKILDFAHSDRGMKSIVATGGDFESALLDLIRPWLEPGRKMPVAACGMVGAKQGWIEAPYSVAPCSPTTQRYQAPTHSHEIEVWIHGGIQQPKPADVMRGEETQIAGLLAEGPDYEGLVCLPGTHTKWVTVSQGKIQRFRTYLTGEVFALLSEQSVLKLTLASEGWDRAAFLEGFQSTLERPETLLSECFGLRAEALLNDLEGVVARSRLSGFLLGHEISGVTKEGPKIEAVTLVAADSLMEIYEAALDSIWIYVRTFSTESAILGGLAKGRNT
ncbi:MAG: 2-dehydro-3-deoxygalactonokinase [Verrucomicrobiota bacterium]